MGRLIRRIVILAGVVGLVVTVLAAPGFAADKSRPNILVIWGDDIGMWNISAYHRGMLGNRTPNIDRLANEGAIFTDYYAEQSCTAGRSAFITGQHLITRCCMTTGPTAEEGGFADTGPAGIALAVLRDIRGACACCIEPCD